MQIGGTYIIDFAKLSKIPKFNVNIKSGDTKRTIKLILLKNNKVLNLNKYNIVVAAKKNNMQDIFNSVKIIDAESGTCSVEITEQMLALNIDLPCEIVLYGADGTVASSSDFVINKLSSIRDEQSIVSSSEFTALTNALSEVKNIDVTYRKNSVSIQLKDLHTDVKEAMTGGSVPVVGINSVGPENIIPGSVNYEKLDKSLEADLKQIPINLSAKGYILNPRNIQIIEESNKLYFKFDQVNIRNPFTDYYIWDNIVSQFQSKIENKNGIEMFCLTDGESLCFNMITKKLELVAWLGIEAQHYVIAYFVSGHIRQSLLFYYLPFCKIKNLNNELDNLNTFKTNISNSLSSIAYITDSQTVIYKIESNKLYFKFDQVNIRNPFTDYYIWDNIVSQFKNKIENKNGIEMFCLTDGESLCFNMITKKLELVAWLGIEYYHSVIAYFANSQIRNSAILDSINYNNISSVAKLKSNFYDITYRNTNKINRIKKIISQQNYNTASLIFMTDNHSKLGKELQTDGVRCVKEISESIDIKCIVNGGDIGNDYASSKDLIFDSYMDIMNSYYSINKPILTLIGNHDDATGKHKSSPNNCFEPVELYNIMQKRSDSYISRDTENICGNYFYYDIAESKIRVICLNTSDIPYIIENEEYKYDSYNYVAIREKQLNWLNNIALNVQKDYSVIVFSHVPLIDGMIGSSSCRNGLEAFKILQCFNEASTGAIEASLKQDDFTIKNNINIDFTKNINNSLIGIFCGHTHYDNLIVKNGITCISTLCAYTSKFNDSPDRIIGTDSETAFDVITVDTKLKNVKLVRFGAGEDREFKY